MGVSSTPPRLRVSLMLVAIATVVLLLVSSVAMSASTPPTRSPTMARASLIAEGIEDARMRFPINPRVQLLCPIWALKDRKPLKQRARSALVFEKHPSVMQERLLLV